MKVVPSFLSLCLLALDPTLILAESMQHFWKEFGGVPQEAGPWDTLARLVSDTSKKHTGEAL